MAQQMSHRSPRLSIGLPVYNGAQYLEDSLRAVREQPFEDWELIISDNASTDATERIGREYQSRDERIRYYRNPTNRGVAWNHNRVFELSAGSFFMWAAHDDLRNPEYVPRCLSVLERDPSVVLCFSESGFVDEEGRPLEKTDGLGNIDSDSPPERFQSVIRLDHTCEAMYGVIRADVLRKTALHGYFPDSDRVLLAELALHGRFWKIPERLFFRRVRISEVYPGRHVRMAMFDPAKAGKIISFPHLIECAELLRAVRRVPLRFRDRVRCYASMLQWLWAARKGIAGEFSVNCYQAQRHIRRRMGNLDTAA